MDISISLASNEGQEISIHTAATIVNDCITKDRIFTDNAVKLTREIRCSRPPKVGVSGLASIDYKDFASTVEVREFTNVETRSIPGELREQLKRMRSHCGMGMYPEISRAWMTIDSDLFIWNWNQEDDLAFFDGVPNSILTTVLANVKPGVFNNNVHFVLAVATTVELVLYAVCFYDRTTTLAVPVGVPPDYAAWEMCLMPDCVYSVNLDGAVVSSMKATADGRIFFSADDSLFELCYEEETWFRSKCRKVNHSKGYGSFITNLFSSKDVITQLVIDEERHILYTLSAKKTIQVFDLGIDGTGCHKVLEESAESLNHHLMSHPNLDSDSFKNVVTLSVVPVRESHYLNFVLVNSRGVRMYFTCLPPDMDLYYFSSIGGDMNEAIRINSLSLSQTRPRTIRLVHLRIPRDYNCFRSAEDQVYLMCHTSDTTVLLKSGPNSRASTAVFMSSASYALSSEVCENVESQSIGGLIWSIEKLADAPSIRYHTAQGMLPDMNPPLAVYQHLTQPDRFHFMTSEGVSFVDRLRPTDILRNILSTYGGDSKQCAAFCNIHGPRNTMTMILSILCSTDRANARIKDDAQRVFFIFGGEAQTLGVNSRNDMMNRSTFSTAAGESAYGQSMLEFAPRTPRITSTPFAGGAPPDLNFSGASSIYPGTTRISKPMRHSTPQQQTMMSELDGHSKNIVMSYRHDALYTYFSRLLGKFWTSTVCYKRNNMLYCKYSSAELTWLSGQVRMFQDTINRYKLIPPVDTGFVSTSIAFGKVEAKLKERKSLMDLSSLLTVSCEALYLLKLINDHQFNAVTTHLSDRSKGELLSATFCDFVGSGKQLAGDLIGSLIRHYLGDGATTHSISGSLREYCSSLFSMEDATAAEAMEMLQCVVKMPSGADREKLVGKACSLLRNSILKVNLHSVSELLRHVRMFESIVQLALYKAEQVDPRKAAILAYRQGSIAEDREAAEALARRKDAYYPIIQTLSMLSDPTHTSQLGLGEHMAHTYRSDILKLVMRCDDELANVEIFDWLVDHKMSSMLVECGNAYVEHYLHHKIETRDDVRYQDVLWRHCEKNRKFIAAATLLHELADGGRREVTLKQRISYLSQALVCCRSEQSNEKVHIFVQELEDKLEVAMVQERIRELVNSIAPNAQFSRAELKAATAQLDEKLFSLNELFSDFAERFELPLAKLNILRCANHFDEETISDVWVQIIEKEFNHYQQLGDAFPEVFITKLVSIGRDNRNSPLYFPTDNILKFTLLKSFEHGLDPVWLFGLYRVPNIGLIKVLESVHEQYENGSDPFWKVNPQAEFYLANAVLRIGDEFSENAKSFQSMQRRIIINKFLDLLATFSISVSGVSGTRDQITSFKMRSRKIQNKLDQLLSVV